MNRKRREQLIRQLGGQCVKCGSVLGLEIDHVIPILVGNHPKQNTLRDRSMKDTSNLQVLCYVCHRYKSKSDMEDHYNAFIR